jgi:serine protease Do
MGARMLTILTVPTLAAAGLVALAASPADDPEILAQALALEKQMAKIIAGAEPSIACILVSRNETFRKLYMPPHVGDDPPAFSKSFKYYERACKLGRPSWADEKTADLPKERLESLKRQVNLAEPTLVPEAFGSGVVVDAEKGLILTNYHVVQGAVVVYVRLPGNHGGYANIHAADSRSDLAVLKVDAGVTKHIEKAIPLGDADKLRRGQFILSLANPYAAGFRDGQPSASWGILSNIRRRTVSGITREEERVKSLHHYGTLLQLDARLNLGCSGGAVLNLRGELVGLSTAAAAIDGSETAGGFAIPFDAGFRRILDVLKDGDEVDYGFLGVGWNPDDLAARGKKPGTPGVRISRITSGAPAYTKVQSGDRILEVAGTKVDDLDDLFLFLGTQLAGSRVEIKVNRHDKDIMVNVTLAKMYIPSTQIFSDCKKRPFERGLRVEYTSMLIRNGEAFVAKLPQGVLVDEVRPNSAAARAKLMPGQVIMKVNQRDVTNPAEFSDAVRAAGGGPLELLVSGINPEDPRQTVRLP